MPSRLRLLVVPALLVLAANGAAADAALRSGWGPRIGFTSNPDQLHLGAHTVFRDVANPLLFQASMEFGVGDDRTLAAFQADVAYPFSTMWGRWSPFAGGGLGLFVEGDDGRRGTEVGTNLLTGLERSLSNGDRLLLEGRIGLFGSPDFKLTFGYTFF